MAAPPTCSAAAGSSWPDSRSSRPRRSSAAWPTSDTLLILARAAQGLGAAFTAPAALSIVTTLFPEGKERNTALGIWGMLAGMGSAVGLLFGGILVEYAGWEWIFFVNVPVGLLVLGLALAFVPESRLEGARRRYDALGAVLVTGALVLLVFAISQAPEVGWATFRTIASLVVAGALLAAFLFREAADRRPARPPAHLPDPDRRGREQRRTARRRVDLQPCSSSPPCTSSRCSAGRR